MIRVGFAHNSAGGNLGTTSCSVSYTATNGNTLLVVVATSGSGGVPTVSDGVNSYAMDNSQGVVGNGQLYIWRADQITGGALVVQASILTGTLNFLCFVVEYSGLDIDPVDRFNENSGNTQAVSSGTFVTDNAYDLIFSMATDTLQPFSAAGSTLIDSAAQAGGVVPSLRGCVADRIVSRSDLYSGDFTIPSGDQWGCICMAYKGAEIVPSTFPIGLLGVAMCSLALVR